MIKKLVYQMFLNYKYRSTNKFVSEIKIKKNDI